MDKRNLWNATIPGQNAVKNSTFVIEIYIL